MKETERMERLKAITKGVHSASDNFHTLYEAFTDMCSSMIELNGAVTSNLIELSMDNIKKINYERSQEEADVPHIRMKCSCGYEWNVTELDDLESMEFAKCSCCGASIDRNEWDWIVCLFGSYGDMVRDMINHYLGYHDRARLITFGFAPGNTDQFLKGTEEEENEE